MFSTILLGLLAGMAISIGGAMNLLIGGGILGGFVFSIGLIMVCGWGLQLYTGQVHKILSRERTPYEMAVMLVSNVAGGLATGGLIQLTPLGNKIYEAGAAIAEARIDTGILGLFLPAILCGILVNFAVSEYQKDKNFFVLILPVATFVFLGCPHCVADAFYASFGGNFLNILSILIVAAGNTIGCCLVPLCKKTLRL